jgi:hypothetical protein
MINKKNVPKSGLKSTITSNTTSGTKPKIANKPTSGINTPTARPTQAKPVKQVIQTSKPAVVQRTHKRMNTLTGVNANKLKTVEKPLSNTLGNKFYNPEVNKNSSNRLNEYSSLFSMINSAVVDLGSSINEIMLLNNRKSFVNNNLAVAVRENYGFMVEPVLTEDGCDFSESHMYEGVEVKRADLYKLNKGNSTEESVVLHIDNTYVEYESILTEENDLQRGNLKHFNQAKTNLQNSDEEESSVVVFDEERHIGDKYFSEENTNSTSAGCPNPKESERCLVI